MAQFGKTLAMIGVGLVVLGGILWALGAAFPNFKPGRLPGDIAIESDSGGVYIPITTMILVSVVLTLIFWLVGMVKR